ncbi:MAG: DUF302 domain-containing protein [Candidatus Heimdallarchaeota archaeon]|nr:DUF302 domain-containing protein [Candidatus Heimdallarchaeota archaeon]MDH5647545.1 DUF302 domain-containing protein [Candidatus Heimdallarchaeota archaeon]
MEIDISVELSARVDFDTVESTVKELLAEQGFGILTYIDVQDVMKEKLNLEKRKYKILGACNPPRANKVMDVNPLMGLLLPCNVLVYETENNTIVVSAIKPTAIFNIIEIDELKPIASEVEVIMQSIIDQVKSKFS